MLNGYVRPDGRPDLINLAERELYSMSFLNKIFGNHSDKELKRINPIVDKIEALGPEYAALTDEQLKAKTPEFKQRLADGETLDDILPEAFATAREASWRVLGMDDLKQDVNLRAYANEKPVDAYKRDGYDMFEEMVSGIRAETVRRLFTVRIRKEEGVQRKSVSKNATASAGGDDTVKKQPVKKVPKPGRNDPCPCGKWKADGSRPLKYKECCGKNE